MSAALEQPAPTFADVWRMFQETNRQLKETDRQLKERAAETDRQLKERAAETDRQLKETDRQLKERAAETDRQFKERALEADRRFQETERVIKEDALETRKRIKEVTDNIGRLGNRLGEFVEDMVKPGLVRVFQAQGLKVHRTMQNLSCKDDAGRLLAQVDLLVVDSDTAIVVECKSYLSIDDVNDHIERMGVFKSCWPEYAAYKLLGAVAAMVLPEGVGRYAYRKGLFVLAQNGEMVEIRNDADFQPKVW